MGQSIVKRKNRQSIGDKATDPKHHVVVVGGGFGGLYTVRALRRADVRITLVDRRNHHLFQPLLYQVATGGLSPAHIAHPLRSIFRKDKNVQVLMGEVTDVDPDEKLVKLPDGELRYDTLVVAAGATSHYFGSDQWESSAPSLKSIEDATEIRQRILRAFEAAERAQNPDERRSLLNFVVVGGGPTGVELAGTLGEIANFTLREDFRSIDPSDARILLIEGGERILPAYHEDLAARAARDLHDLGVEVWTDTKVEDIGESSLRVKDSSGIREIPAHTLLWAAGVKACPLADVIARRTGARADRIGRIMVTGSLCLEAYPDLFVIGDMAHCKDDNGDSLPGVAPVAMQQGRHVAETIRRRIAGEPDRNFTYSDRGSMATIGRSRAIADLGWVRFGGAPAWATWLLIHLLYLVAFENRVLVLTQWAWNYCTWHRGARLITGRLWSSPSPSSPYSGETDSMSSRAA